MAVPALWSDWPSIERRIRQADRVVLFLDYDGTLTPIAKHPLKALLSLVMKKRLQILSRRPDVWIALISGRALQDVKHRAGIRKLWYVGNHGLEVQGPAFHHINPAAKKSRPVLRKIEQQLQKALEPVPGAWVENKGLTLSIHYRQVRTSKQMLVQSLFHQVVNPYRLKRQVYVTSGKMVLEVRPPVHWTKGTVVAWLLARQMALSPEKRVLPIYAGDDLTDEDAFKALRNRGITITVGRSNPLTFARYRVGSPAEIGRLLEKIRAVRSEKAA